MSILIIIILIGRTYSVLTPFDQKITHDDEFGEKLEFDLELAKRWAPVFIQFTNIDQLEPEHGYAADFLTSINYDGDWQTNNNWDNLGDFRDKLDAHVYYWGVTDREYTILGYMTYHPRDWDNSPIGLEHENDAEGVIILLKSIDETNYSPVVVSTLAHNSLHHYTLAESEIPVTKSAKNTQHSFELDPYTKSPVIYIESMGHGIFGSIKQIDDTDSFIKYLPSNQSEHPRPDQVNASISYSLLPIAPIWDLRYDENVFFKSGHFKSDNSGTCATRIQSLNFCSTKAAIPPWLWDQNQHYPGQLWYEPLIYYQSVLNLDI